MALSRHAGAPGARTRGSLAIDQHLHAPALRDDPPIHDPVAERKILALEGLDPAIARDQARPERDQPTPAARMSLNRNRLDATWRMASVSVSWSAGEMVWFIVDPP